MRQGIKEKDIKDFEKYAEKLSAVLKRIQEYQPKANAYLSMNELNLMSDQHLEYSREEYQDFVVTSVIMPGFDGGDW